VERVPSDFINSLLMPFVRFLVLAAVGFGAFMDVPFFGPNNEGERVKSIEVKAKTTGQRDKRSLFIGLFVLLVNQLKPYNLLGFELVFHQYPIHDSSIGRDTIEVVVFADIGVPNNLTN